MSKQIEHVHFVSTLSKGRNFTKNSFDIINGNNVEAMLDFVEATFDLTLLKEAFDNVVSTLLLVWTGLNDEIVRRVRVKSRPHQRQC